LGRLVALTSSADVESHALHRRPTIVNDGEAKEGSSETSIYV
jgi:hypothetical protein